MLVYTNMSSRLAQVKGQCKKRARKQTSRTKTKHSPHKGRKKGPTVNHKCAMRAVTMDGEGMQGWDVAGGRRRKENKDERTRKNEGEVSETIESCTT